MAFNPTIPAQTTGLGVAAKIAVTGNVVDNVADKVTVPGFNNVQLSISGINGFPTTFQLTPVIEDVAGNPWSAPGAAFTLSAVAASSPGALTLTSVAASLSGVAVYTGTITNGGSNAFAGVQFVVAGFDDAVNNGTFYCTASTTTTLTLTNAVAVADTHAGTATGASGSAVYTGTVTGGNSNAYVGLTFVVTGFTGANNNGDFIVTASSGTTLTLSNPNATAVTAAGTATSQELLSPVANQLGAASPYSLLAYSGITNTGSSVLSGGNIGSSPTVSIVGFPPGVLVAPAVVDNAHAGAAQTALAAAITYYQGLTPTASGLADLSTGGNGSTAATYTAGNYFGSTSLTMPTGIILDAQGNPNAVFVFVAGTTINLASGQTVALVNGAQAANVVFVAGSSFTSVATSTVNGNVLAAVSITLGGGVLNGRALANTGAVTISTATTVTVPFVGGSVFGNLLTYVAYGFKSSLPNTYVPYGNPNNNPVCTVSPTGLISAGLVEGGSVVEVSFPAFNNSIGDIVSPTNIMNGLPVNKIYSSVNVTVGA